MRLLRSCRSLIVQLQRLVANASGRLLNAQSAGQVPSEWRRRRCRCGNHWRVDDALPDDLRHSNRPLNFTRAKCRLPQRRDRQRIEHRLESHDCLRVYARDDPRIDHLSETLNRNHRHRVRNVNVHESINHDRRVRVINRLPIRIVVPGCVGIARSQRYPCDYCLARYSPLTIFFSESSP